MCVVPHHAEYYVVVLAYNFLFAKFATVIEVGQATATIEAGCHCL
jgi:hypothetical protein